ncbi:MAG: NADH-quinone oxidoreductase subunit NuoH [Coriobacteriia bacterium]
MSPAVVILLRVLAALGLMLFNGVVLILMLRKVLARIHVRIGPNRVGPWGLLQTVADVVKLLTKEDFAPRAVDKALFTLAPMIVFTPALAAYAALPFSDTWHIVDLDTGLLYTFAVLSLIPIGILMAGWASANKWSLVGGLRAAAQQIAYEVPLLLAALGPVMIAGSMNLSDIVRAQSGHMLGFIPRWFVLPQLPAFALFFVAMLAELNQTPFDMSEAESELITGFANEYSGMRFGFLFLAEFSNSFVMSALFVTLFFGGWLGGAGVVPGPVVFMLKTYLCIAVLMWVRGTLPRIRIDQMLSLGWKALIPLSLVWIVVTGVALKVLSGGVSG